MPEQSSTALHAPDALTSHGEPRRRYAPYFAFNPALASVMAFSDGLSRIAPKRARALPKDRRWTVLFCNLAHLGDVTVQLPLIARLKASAQVERVDVLAGRFGAGVLQAFPVADKVHLLDNWTLSRATGGKLGKLIQYMSARSAMVSALRDQHYDIAIDSFGLFGNAASVLWGAEIPVRCGFNTCGADKLYTDVVDWAFDAPLSMAQRGERLIAPLKEMGLDLPDAAALPFIPDPQALQQISNLGAYAVLHLGRGDHVQRWTLDGWREVAIALRQRGLKVVFTGAQNEAEYGRAVRSELADLDLVGAGSIAFLATVLRDAALLISVDTLAPHIAGLFATPTVVVPNGRQPLAWWRPPHPYARQVTSPTACAPCSRTKGCETMACIRLTPGAAVIAAADDVLAHAARDRTNTASITP